MSFDICATVGRNTGQIRCDRRRGFPALMLVGGVPYEAAEYATPTALQATIAADINRADGDARKIYPFPQIENVANNTEANTTGTTGAGLSLVLRAGKPAYTFGVITGSTTEKALVAFNNQIVPVRIIDKQKAAWGELTDGGEWDGNLAQIFVTAKPFSDGNSIDTEYTQVEVRFLDSSEELAAKQAFGAVNSVTSFVGLTDVNLELVNKAANVWTVKPIVPQADITKKVSLFDRFSDEIVAEIANIITSAASGADYATPLTIDTVAADADAKEITITFDSTEHTALPAATPIAVFAATPSALNALDIPGIEIQPLYDTK